MSGGPTIGEILAAALAEPQPPLLRAGYSIGDLHAMRELAEQAYSSISVPGGMPLVGYVEAITLQRLIAVSGSVDDKRTLVFLLSQFAAFWREGGEQVLSTTFEAQALQLAEALSDDGDDEMANLVAASADKLPAEVHLEVKRLREGVAG